MKFFRGVIAAAIIAASFSCFVPAAKAQNSDAYTAGVTPGVAGFTYGWNGTTWDRLQSGATNADSIANTTLGALKSQSYSLLWNGSSWDRWKDAAANLPGSSTIGVPLVISVQGTSAAMNVSSATNVKGTIGRLFKVIVITAASTATSICDTVTACAAGNTILTIPSTAVVGQIYDVNAPAITGIRLEPGTSGVYTVIYQ